MLRFIKHNLTGIDGVEIFPLISLLIFVIFFAFVVTYVIRMKKKEVDLLSALPLEDSDAEMLEARSDASLIDGRFGKGVLMVLILLAGNYTFAQDGAGLFKAKCNVCHMLGKDGTGPNLKGAKQRWEDAGEGEFIYRWVQNPQELVASGDSKYAVQIDKWSATAMTPQDLSNEEIDAVLDYVDNYVEPVASETPPPTDGGEVPVTYVPNYEKNLTLFYWLLIAIGVQLVAILMLTNSTRSLVEYKDKRDKAAGGNLKSWLILVGIMGAMAVSNQTLALNFVEAGENPEAPWLLVEDSDIHLLVAVNLALLFLVFHFRRLFLDIAMIVRPERMERISKRRKRRLNKILTDVVPIEEEETILMHHEYDGIRELDNNLPPWWVWGFYFTIGFAIVYLLHFHILKTGDLQLAEYEKSVATAAEETAAYLDKMAMNVDENNVTLLTDDGALSTGKTLFEVNCVTCHNPDGSGNQIGPNLTDKNWIYGYDIKDIFTTVKYGRPNGMPEHNSKLNPVQLQQVASYVLSLPPAEGREPQGDIIEK